MNTNYLLFLYANQKSFDIPSRVQSGLREKIKDSDFLVADDSGTHRIVGLRYYSKSDLPPIITCVCMRHEMNVAKQIAFELRKKIYYNSAASARLFKYRPGTYVQRKDYECVLNLYTKYLFPKRHNNISIKSNGAIYIKNRLLPPYFRVSYLIELLGEPDETGVEEGWKVKAKYYRWFDYGIEAVTLPGHKNYVSLILIYAKETVISSMRAATVPIYLGDEKIENSDQFDRYFKFKNHYICIRSLNKDQCVDCKKGEIAMLFISFSTEKKSG